MVRQKARIRYFDGCGFERLPLLRVAALGAVTSHQLEPRAATLPQPVWYYSLTALRTPLLQTHDHHPHWPGAHRIHLQGLQQTRVLINPVSSETARL